MNLAGRVAVVTGGAAGIGAAVVEQLRRSGAIAVVWDSASGADIECDVADPLQVDAAMRRTLEMHGTTPAILVAAAGVRVGASAVVDLSADDLARTFAVNTYGVLFCVQAVTRELIRHGRDGSIVVVSSVNGTIVDERRAAYSMSKAAVNMLVRVMAREVGRHDIRINAVAPGPTATAMLGEMLNDKVYLEEVARRTPLGRVGSPELVAEAILNLLASSWVTGQVVAVDGGSSLSTGRTSP